MSNDRLKAWVHNVKNNPIDDDQLEMAKAIENLFQERDEYREALKISERSKQLTPGPYEQILKVELELYKKNYKDAFRKERTEAELKAFAYGFNRGHLAYILG